MAQTKNYRIRISEEGARQLDSSFGRVEQRLKQIAIAAAAAFGTKLLFDFGKGAIKVAGQFEFLKVRLENMYGSVEAGNKAFDTFNKLAAKTPFELRNVVEAGASLKAFGLDAEKTLGITADLAAFMGLDIVEAASAMGRAFAGGAGAADIFRERGILTLIETSTGLDRNKASLDQFREAMFRAFQDPNTGIIGATEKLAKTTVGMESNVKDAYSRLQAAVGEKFAEKYKKALEDIITATEGLISFVNSKEFDNFIKKWGLAFDEIENFLRKYSSVFRAIEDSTSGLTEQLNNLAEGGREGIYVFNAMTGEWEKMQKGAEDTSVVISQKVVPALGEMIDGFTVIQNQVRQGIFAQGFEFFSPEQERIIGHIKTTFEQLNPIAQKFSGLLSTAIVAQWQRGESALSNFVASFKSAVAAMAAEILAKLPIFLLLNIFSGGSFGKGFSFASFLGFGGRQHGGETSPGRPYVVGEGGTPELFIPTQAGRIEPGGGGSNTIIIQALDSQNVEMWLRERKGAEQIVKATQDIIQ